MEEEEKGDTDPLTLQERGTLLAYLSTEWTVEDTTRLTACLPPHVFRAALVCYARSDFVTSSSSSSTKNPPMQLQRRLMQACVEALPPLPLPRGTTTDKLPTVVWSHILRWCTVPDMACCVSVSRAFQKCATSLHSWEILDLRLFSNSMKRRHLTSFCKVFPNSLERPHTVRLFALSKPASQRVFEKWIGKTGPHRVTRELELTVAGDWTVPDKILRHYPNLVRVHLIYEDKCEHDFHDTLQTTIDSLSPTTLRHLKITFGRNLEYIMSLRQRLAYERERLYIPDCVETFEYISSSSESSDTYRHMDTAVPPLQLDPMPQGTLYVAFRPTSRLRSLVSNARFHPSLGNDESPAIWGSTTKSPFTNLVEVDIGCYGRHAHMLPLLTHGSLTHLTLRNAWLRVRSFDCATLADTERPNFRVLKLIDSVYSIEWIAAVLFSYVQLEELRIVESGECSLPSFTMVAPAVRNQYAEENSDVVVDPDAVLEEVAESTALKKNGTLRCVQLPLAFFSSSRRFAPPDESASGDISCSENPHLTLSCNDVRLPFSGKGIHQEEEEKEGNEESKGEGEEEEDEENPSRKKEKETKKKKNE